MTSPLHSLNKSSISPSPYKSILPLCLCLHVQHTVNNHSGVVAPSSVVHWRPLLVRLRQWLPGPTPQWKETESAPWVSHRSKSNTVDDFCMLINPFVRTNMCVFTVLCVFMETLLNKKAAQMTRKTRCDLLQFSGNSFSVDNWQRGWTQHCCRISPYWSNMAKHPQSPSLSELGGYLHTSCDQLQKQYCTFKFIAVVEFKK